MDLCFTHMLLLESSLTVSQTWGRNALHGNGGHVAPRNFTLCAHVLGESELSLSSYHKYSALILAKDHLGC